MCLDHKNPKKKKKKKKKKNKNRIVQYTGPPIFIIW